MHGWESSKTCPQPFTPKQTAYLNEKTNGWSNTSASSPLVNPKTGPSGFQSQPLFTTTGRTPPRAYRPIKSYLVMRPPSLRHPLTKLTTRPLSNELSEWYRAETKPSKPSIGSDATESLHLPNSK